MKLIVGLGNPGPGYAHNRHNIGFMCVSHFAGTHRIKFDKKQGKARTGSGEIAGNKVVVARPQTYMNSSGQAVSLLARRFNISLDDLIVIHDDLDLPLGKMRLRRGGGSGGHRGVASIITELGSQDFPRLRVGIGRPIIDEDSPGDRETQIIDYVLGDFTPDEEQVVTGALPRVSEAILYLLSEGLAAAMNRYNQGNSAF